MHRPRGREPLHVNLGVTLRLQALWSGGAECRFSWPLVLCRRPVAVWAGNASF